MLRTGAVRRKKCGDVGVLRPLLTTLEPTLIRHSEEFLHRSTSVRTHAKRERRALRAQAKWEAEAAEGAGGGGDVPAGLNIMGSRAPKRPLSKSSDKSFPSNSHLKASEIHEVPESGIKAISDALGVLILEEFVPSSITWVEHMTVCLTFVRYNPIVFR
jgi:hypothetical protein